MIQEEKYDVAVIGAGAAGLCAASVCASAGKSTIVIDREDHPGGILRQCIHNGFGLRYFKEELTGPEYAERVAEKAERTGACFRFGTTVISIRREGDGTLCLTALSAAEGVRILRAEAVILAMGCRERNRGNLAVPGSRPAGVFTAGAAQHLLNIEGILPGKKAVIAGSGDIGLIMARRLSWAGIRVEAVVEIMPYPAGLTRNIVQCLNDFHIPLLLEHSLVNILGRERVEAVEVAPLSGGMPVTERKFRIDCDTVLFSVGLIPENELSAEVGVELNPATGGPLVDSNYETSVPGIFACGNVLHVHDLVDYVSQEAANAGKYAAEYLQDFHAEGLSGGETKASVPILTGNGVRYTVPQSIRLSRMEDSLTVRFRVTDVYLNCRIGIFLNDRPLRSIRRPRLAPGEMEQVILKKEELLSIGQQTGNPLSSITIAVQTDEA